MESIKIIDNYDPFMNQIYKNIGVRVLVLGSTGSGKSALCNTLIGDNECTSFGENEKIDSYTMKPEPVKVQWFDKELKENKGKKEEFLLIDTPGLNDSYDNDSKNIEVLVDHLKDKIVTVNCFILVLNSQTPRLDEPMKSMLKLLGKIFTNEFLKHTVVVFTRWAYDENSILRRKAAKENEETKASELNNELRKLLNSDINDLECFFIDNSYNKTNIMENSSDEEVDLFYKTLGKLKKKILSFPPYFCDKLQKEKTEKDFLKKEVQKLEKINKRHKKSRGGCKICDCLQYHYSTEQIKKYSSSTMAATSGSGGIIGGVGGLITGLGLGAVISGAMYFNYNICICSHDKKDHYNPNLFTSNDIDEEEDEIEKSEKTDHKNNTNNDKYMKSINSSEEYEVLDDIKTKSNNEKLEIKEKDEGKSTDSSYIGSAYKVFSYYQNAKSYFTKK